MSHLKGAAIWAKSAAFFFTVLVTEALASRIWGWPNVWPWALLGLVVSSLVALWRRRKAVEEDRIEENRRAYLADQLNRQRLASHFALCKPISELRIADLGFQVLDPGDEPDPQVRPYFPAYVPRRFESIERPSDTPDGTFTELDIVRVLNEGGSVAIVGHPTEGKSRSLLEILRELPDHTLVTPRFDQPAPEDDAFSLVAGKRVVLVLEDLSDYVGGHVDLILFLQKLRRRAASVSIAATCRSGPELVAVRNARSTNIARFFESIEHKLRLPPASDPEKRQLADAIGRSWEKEGVARYPTLGAITMVKPFAAMAERFRTLTPLERDTVRALHLLLSAGVLPLSHERLVAVVEHVFQRSGFHFADTLDALAECGFVTPPATNDPVLPDRAYIASESVAPYREGKTAQDDFGVLRHALGRIRDAEGLFLLSIAVEDATDDIGMSMACLQTALEGRPDDPQLLCNLGMALGRVGRGNDALEVFDRILRDDPDDDTAHAAKGQQLLDLERYNEALAAFDSARDIGDRKRSRPPRAPDTEELATNADQEPFRTFQEQGRVVPHRFFVLTNRALALAHLERDDEAVAEYEEALRVVPDEPITLANKSRALSKLGRFDDALDAAERSLRARPDWTSALEAKAHALSGLGLHDRELEIYERLSRAEPNDLDAIHGKASALYDLGRHGEALEAFDTVVAGRPERPNAHFGRGMALKALERLPEAIQSFETAVQIAPGRTDIWVELGTGLGRLSRHEEALAAMGEALRLDAKNVVAWTNRGVALGQLRRRAEEVESYDRALGLETNSEPALSNKLAALAEMGHFDEALRVCAQLLAIRPTDTSVLATQAKAFGALGHMEEALRVYDRILTVAPNDLLATLNKGWILTLLQDSRNVSAADPAEWLCKAWRAGAEQDPELAEAVIEGLRLVGRTVEQCAAPATAGFTGR